MKNRLINILYTIPNFKTAGSQDVLISILKGLDAAKFNIFIAVESHPELIPSIVLQDNRLHLNYSGKILKDATCLSKILRRHKIDILHSWDYKSDIAEALACRLSNVKYLFTKKNNSWSRKWHLKSVLANYIAYDNPDMVERFFKPNYLNNKAIFIPHGVDITKFKPGIKLTKQIFNLCCIGNIVENKNQEDILKALIELPEHIHLNLYGREDKAYRNKLNLIIKTNSLQDRVHFNRFVKNEDIPTVLNQQDIFVLASKQEGLPVSILEALSCGIPVLSSDSGGGASFILKNENGGLIFNSLQELIKQVKLLENNPELYEAFSKKAIFNVRERFSIQKEINAYKDLYLMMCNQLS